MLIEEISEEKGLGLKVKEIREVKGLGLKVKVKEEEEEEEEELAVSDRDLVKTGVGRGVGGYLGRNSKRVLVGVGARALFYPTLVYNVFRNKIQTEFRWWDWIDEFVLLGAVPFRSDVRRLKDLGVGAVVTLNEPYETLVPTSFYEAHGIRNLVLPTRDYLFAPSLDDICQAVDFIHENASCGRSTYVHCKAGRGRSTTIVICYLVKYKQMKPDIAYAYVKSIRPRVLLAASQLKAVEGFYNLQAKKTCFSSSPMSPIFRSPKLFTGQDLVAFDDGSVVIITNADLDGYEGNEETGIIRNEIWTDFSLIYRVRVTGKTALAKLSCLWFRYHTPQKLLGEEVVAEESRSLVGSDVGGFTLDIHVYSA
ncbi:OLC1v1031690C1 [Oldenlandia corymbosa var. corymbosa]|uniref:phosphatidylglycerophosphatase n=1 Tax=Oldenlandia corymbosa var. corymbosa TaxID=529605 RepID=A0AAV1CJG2_OLDCO|nr:OLC1v1031690C1 [Oldenlandia corymbosa var. corymbosa]